MKADFISDNKLKQRVEDSIEYVLALYEMAEKSENETFQAETSRVIVLYCVSIMEALFLSIYHKQNKKIKQIEFRNVSKLATGYVHENLEGDVVVAVRCEKEKTEPEIGFNELLSFLKGETLTTETVDRIKKINQLRNSFHLRKQGESICGVVEVEEALSLLELTLKHTPRFL